MIVENENGKVIAAHYAAAKGDWMTEEFVQFTSELKVDFEDSTAGTLVLKKDNPSGLPENDDELRIPLLFDSTIADSATDINDISAWNHPVLDAWIKHMKEYESDFGLDQMEISKVSPINVDSSGKVEEGFPEAITSDPPDGSLSLAVSARGESPDSEVFLIDNDNNFKRVLFCGTPCRWDGGGWISDSMFFVAGMNEDFETSTVESVSFRPVLYVFDLEADTMTTYYGPIVIPDTI